MNIQQMLGMIMQTRGGNQQLSSLQNMIKTINNPNEILNQLYNSNPQVKIILDQFKNSGLSAEDFLNNYAKQQGIKI